MHKKQKMHKNAKKIKNRKNQIKLLLTVKHRRRGVVVQRVGRRTNITRVRIPLALTTFCHFFGQQMHFKTN